MKITVRGKTDLNKVVKKIVDEISYDLYDQLISHTPRGTGRAADGWQLNKSRRVNSITNKVPYISELDKGHSDQAPYGMTKPSIDRIRSNASSGKYKRK